MLRSTCSLLLLACVMSACAPDSPPRTGGEIYSAYCSNCHTPSGGGVAGAFPPLQRTEWVLGDEGRLIRLVLNGLRGPIVVKGERYNNAMPPHGFLDDEQIAAVLSFVRSEFGNDAAAVSSDAVQKVRGSLGRTSMWTPGELRAATGVPE